MSLRTRLFVILILSTSIIWCCGIGWIYFVSRSEIQHLLDRRLMEAARMVVSLAGQPGAPTTRALDEPVADVPLPVSFRYEHRLTCQIWSFDGRLVGRSSNAPATTLAQASSGFSEPVVDGTTYRVFAIEDPVKGVRVLVGDNLAQRTQIVDDLLRGLVLPAAVMLPLIAVLIWVSIGRGLRPLKRATETISTREAENLTSIDVGHTPSEIRPLISALNALFEKVVAVREHERSFVAYAAHELRTPLAGVKMQAQIAAAAMDSQTRRNALDQTLKGVDRTARLIQQLLAMSKLDAGPSQGPVQWFGLGCAIDHLRGCIGRDLHPERIEVAASAWQSEVAFDRELFDLALRNLLENALQYTPADGAVRVSLTTAEGPAVLAIEDQGPGIPDTERELVRQRFYRGRHRSASGSGLGLSIVEAALERAGAELRLGHSGDLGGLEASVAFAQDRVRLKAQGMQATDPGLASKHLAHAPG